MDKKYIFIFFIFSLCLFVPFGINIFKGNDLIGDVSSLIYIRDSIINNHTLPLWNPYYNQGIPIISDPLSSFLNPLVLLPVLILPFGLAINLILFLSF